MLINFATFELLIHNNQYSSNNINDCMLFDSSTILSGDKNAFIKLVLPETM